LPIIARHFIAPDGYRVIHPHRGSSEDKHGGGIAIIQPESFNVFAFNVGKYSEFKSASVNLSCENSSVTLVSIHRPPGRVSAPFGEQLSDLFDNLLLSGKKYPVCSDLNWPGNGGIRQFDGQL
jgi:hypothetical protein